MREDHPVPAVPAVPALDEAVSMLRAVAPHLDATALAEALWLASRAASTPADASEPDATPPAPAPAGTTGPRTIPEPRTERPPAPSGQAEGGPARTLHERLPGSGTRVTGHAVALPRASALPHALELTRALRPWKRSWRTGRDRALDVSATVDAYARSGELIPVFAPAPERWFDLVLVVDDSPSMQVWRETVHAFTGVLDRLGAFRTLQVRHFRPDSGGELTDPEGRSASAGQLGAPDGRRLVVVVSDCAAPAWRAPEIWQQVRSWARGTPVALLNPLPPKLWRRTGLDLPTVRVTQQVPGAGNAGLDFRTPPLLPRDHWLPVPVLSLSPHSLGRWSRAVMLAAPDGCSAALVPAAGRPEAVGRQESPTHGRAEARTERFLRTASPAAARLAVLCSPFDRLSLDMLHVLRAEHVPDATTADVAEVVSSGVFALETDPAGPVILRASPPVRARLEQELPEHEALRLSRTLSHHLASGHDGLRRLPAVAGGADGGDAGEGIAAEATPLGVALSRTLVLLGLAVESPAAEIPVGEPEVAASPVSLDDPSGHEPWLSESRSSREWVFWERLRGHLAQRDWPPDVMHRLGATTDDVLSRIEDPLRAGSWHRSGLVVAQAGTGRTVHAIGLAAKAVDAGYGAVVVLTGPTNAERRQTQSRVDEWLLGNADLRDILSLTTQNDDFSPFKAPLPPPTESVPLVFVIKKNLRVVKGLRDWLAHVSPLAARPLLVIDLTDTPLKGKARVSATDESVYRLVGGFTKTAYVQYAPFLPALDAFDHPALFPEHFIYHLPTPSDDLGPRPALGTSTRRVTDYETWMPTRHRADHVPPEDLPASLCEAIDAFVLACAARRARRRSPTPDRMLVYVSDFAAVQQRVRDQVQARVHFLADSLRDQESDRALRLRDHLAHLWLSDPRTVSWAEVSAHLTDAVHGLLVVRVSDDTTGMAMSPGVVAICGPRVPPDMNDGLTVSYQLRSSNDYAMFVHSNHWSDGNGDENRRLYAPPDILGIYEHLTTVADEQFQDLRHMAVLGVTPRQSAVRLRSAGPRRTAEDFSGTSVETLSFSLSPEVLRENFLTLEDFVHVLDSQAPAPLLTMSRGPLWQNVPPETVLREFLDVYRPDTRPDRNQLDLLRAYVRRCAAHGELTDWTVRLVSKAGASEMIRVAAHSVGPVVRRPVAPGRPSDGYTVRRLLNPADQFVDLDDEQYATALELTRSEAGLDHSPARPSTHAMRAVRRPDQPLLSIYLLAPPVESAEDPVTPVVGFVVTLPYSPTSGRLRAENGVN
ncbi:SAV_2336 N-terminal domain-related protein [Streptomyces sp. YU58]|uniref:SAV_2336 N-terminal domain-related protein n=1 Tax=Streptomyces sp. SX92 TaxID=3158972 RepID=UPI0027B8ED66|nr:SAV_2336 N-terminal domain-related protein [Streptomyces coralus]WLW50524.1 SAV_2336 N-terminal domain-related protein [Streptomyces coralus]